jgi:hypothetical protein
MPSSELTASAERVPAARPSLKHAPGRDQSRQGWAALLAHFYAQAGCPLFPLERMLGSALPEPYRRLLAHDNDMTPTLERFYGRRIRLRLLRRELEENAYLREVALDLVDASRSVEYGVIRVFLHRFPERARQFILEEQRPLGEILQSEAIAHIGWPQAFFRAEADARMGAILRLRGPGALYGRRNLLLDGHRQVLAEVIEVLAPADNLT